METAIKHYLEPDSPLIFLVGAGISMESPSNLASARKIIEALVHFITPEETGQMLLGGGININLRYEYLIQLFRDYFDEPLEMLNFFNQAQSPNVIHNFLADMILRNHIVMTTNFDTLIELAMKNNPRIDQNKSKIVITKDDFAEYGDPLENIRNGYKVLYKIHGSVTNIFTGEHTIASVNSTLDSIGKGKENTEDILAVPLFKRTLFNRGAKGRVLVVLGYSGGDNLDITPEIHKMHTLIEIIWVDHDQNRIHPEDWIIKSFPLSSDPVEVQNDRGLQALTSGDLDEFLNKVAGSLGVSTVIIRANTRAFVENFTSQLPPTPPLFLPLASEQQHQPQPQPHSPLPHILGPLEWLRDHFEAPPSRMKEACAAEIFANYSEYDLALNHYYNVLKLDKLGGNLRNTANTLNRIGNIHLLAANYDEALPAYRKAYDIDCELQNTQGMADELGNLGLIHMYREEYEQSLHYHQESFRLHSELGNRHNMANELANLGALYMYNGEPQKSYDSYVQGYEIFETLGDLHAMATILSNVGGLYRQMGEQEESLDYLQKGYDIYEKLTDRFSMASQQSNMALIYLEKEEFGQALDHYERALGIYTEIEHPYSDTIREQIAEVQKKLAQGKTNDSPSEGNG